MENKSRTRKRVDSIISKMELLENELRLIRRECSHKSTEIKNYSWRVGTYQEAYLCADCDEFIKYTEDN